MNLRSMAIFTSRTIGEKLLEKPLMDWEAAVLYGLNPLCPPTILESLVLLDIPYWDSERIVRSGQLVIHQDLATDVIFLFDLMFKLGFPIAMMRPVSDPIFFLDGRPSDAILMSKNNTSGFHYRNIAGSTRLSWHAYGRAVDINPLLNPCITASGIEPSEGRYDTNIAGTFFEDHPVVQAFLDAGWIWGGKWKQIQDYHHFEKPLQQTPF